MFSRRQVLFPVRFVCPSVQFTELPVKLLTLLAFLSQGGLDKLVERWKRRCFQLVGKTKQNATQQTEMARKGLLFSSVEHTPKDCRHSLVSRRCLDFLSRRSHLHTVWTGTASCGQFSRVPRNKVPYVYCILGPP